MGNNRGSDFVAGAIIGAAVAGGLAFLFGTEKGKQIRRRVYEEYPELFDMAGQKINEVSTETQKMVKSNVRSAGKATVSLGKNMQKVAK